MDYQKIYDSIIERAKTRNLNEYCEVHHIVPRCLGGSDRETNLVKLTPEEHYLAHQLLVKIHPGSYALVRAAAMMIPNRPSNKLYGWLRRKFAEAQSIGQSGTGNSQHGTRWITNGKEEKKITKKDPLPSGWVDGRKSKAVRQKVEEQRKLEKSLEKQIRREEKIKSLRILYELYVREGFEAVCRTGYTKSKANLVMRFAEYLPEFVPQNGKKRGGGPTL